MDKCTCVAGFSDPSCRIARPVDRTDNAFRRLSLLCPLFSFPSIGTRNKDVVNVAAAITITTSFVVVLSVTAAAVLAIADQ